MSCDLFDRIDSANKGFLTRSELSDYVMQFCNLSETDAEKVVASLIPLNSSSITRNDFTRILEKTVTQKRSDFGSSGDHARLHHNQHSITIPPNPNLQQEDAEFFSSNSRESMSDEMDDEFCSYLKHSSAVSDELGEEQQNLFKIWSTDKPHGDATLEQIFKNFLGRLFVEMAKQQNVIHQENHSLQRLNESEAETIDDLHEHEECELKQVIKQYETQIQGSIENYEKKI